MKGLKNYIFEKFVINKNTRPNKYNADYICDNINDIKNIDEVFDTKILNFIEKNVENVNWPLYAFKVGPDSTKTKLCNFLENVVHKRRKEIFNSIQIPELNLVKIDSEWKNLKTKCLCYRSNIYKNYIEICVLNGDMAWFIFNKD